MWTEENLCKTTSRRFTTNHKSKFDGPHFQTNTVNILSFIFALIFVSFILLGQAGEAWEPSNKMILLLPSKRKCLLVCLALYFIWVSTASYASPSLVGSDTPLYVNIRIQPLNNKFSSSLPCSLLNTIHSPLNFFNSQASHYATNRQIAGSIPDGFIVIFQWHNPSGRTMALRSTQPLTEMSTRCISWR